MGESIEEIKARVIQWFPKLSNDCTLFYEKKPKLTEFRNLKLSYNI